MSEKEEIEELLTHYDQRISDYITSIENKIDTQDKVVADLMKAFFQLSSAVETIIAEMMSPRSDEDKEEFRANINKLYSQQLKIIQSLSHDLETRDPQDVSAAILRMASGNEDTSSG